jgi:serine/threonine protein kinase/Tfp pilus assembly protein PilF
MIGQTVLHYKIMEKLGQGGMGVVYKAEDSRLGRTVALKFLPPELTRDAEAKERFIREARAASALDHANICTIYEINEAEGQTFIAMAYVEGDSLQGRVESGPLDLDEALGIAIQICRGLGEAHDKDIIHRDIKPANVMITPKGQIKIMDFGLAKLLGSGEITEKEVTPGTIAYMSPEQTRGDEVDHRTDIWSLGVVLYEMVAGKRPFRGDYHQAIIYSILNEEPEPVRRVRTGVPRELERIISKALEKNPDRRYQHADELIADLLTVKEQLRTGAVPPRRRPRRFSWVRTLFVAFIVILLAVLTASYFAHRHTRVVQTPGVHEIAAAKWQNSIAVLPFRDFSPGKDQEYFCDGMTEAIIGKLSGLPDLKVISMTSALRYKSPERDIKKIGRELDVAAILEGSIQKEENRIRVRAQLISVADDAHLWSQTYDRELESIFAIQDEISQAIVDVMKIKLLAGERTSFARRHTDNLEAYKAYVQGRFLWNKRTEESLMKAIEYFEEAIEQDPGYAQAYAGLADAYVVLPSNIGYPEEEAIPKVREAALKALELDSTLAEAHSSLALITEMQGNLEEAEREFLKAIELNPGYAYAHYWYSNLLERMNRAEEGSRQREIAFELDPLSVVILTRLAWFRALAGDIEGAAQLFERAIEIEPSRSMTYTAYAGGLRHIGQPGKAAQVYQRAIEELPENREFHNHLAYLYILMGEYEKAIQTASRIVEMAPEDPNSYDTRGDVYAFHGQLDKAIDNYQKAIDIEFYFGNSAGKLASMYIYKGDYARAETIIKRFLSEPDKRFRSAARTGLAYIPLYQGKFTEALALLDEGIAWDKKNGIEDGNRVAKHNTKLFIYWEQEQMDLAWREAELLDTFIARLVPPEDPFSRRTAYIISYAKQGEFDKADSLLQLIREHVDHREPNLMSGYHRVVGVVEFIKGNVQSAIDHLQLGLYENAVPLFETRYFLGLAYLDIGQPAEAVGVLVPALQRYDEHMMQFPIWAVKARCYLGKAYDQLGQREKAIARYEEFLNIWKDADEGMAEVEDARERLKALKIES